MSKSTDTSTVPQPLATDTTKRASRRKKKNAKPEKPYPDFPLFAHATKRWCKKIGGKLVYFGSWADGPEAALENYRLYVNTGRTKKATAEGFTVAELCDRFLDAKKKLIAGGELSPRTRLDYLAIAALIVDHFGKSRLVADVTPGDFEKFRARLATTRGPVALGNAVQRVRTIFKWASENHHVDAAVKFGSEFKRPSKKARRLARAAKGKKLFRADALRAMVRMAGVPLRAMILLGLNGGLGNADCGRLPLDSLDGDWITYHREKTGVERRFPLWPETAAALQDAISQRPAPKKPEAEGAVFVTKYGDRWHKDTPDSPVSKEFAKLARSMYRLTVKAADGVHSWFVQDSVSVTVKGEQVKLGELKEGVAVTVTEGPQEFGEAQVAHITTAEPDWPNATCGVVVALEPVHRSGLGFYTLRHVFRTVADAWRDPPAIDRIMGHEGNDMSVAYREEIADKRLKAVTDHVHAWLYRQDVGGEEE